MKKILTCFCLLIALGASGAEFFISPKGNDQNPGSREKPFATLERARDAARETNEKCTVFLREGTYTLEKTLEFLPEDGGVTWKAYENERVTISGGRVISGWTAEGDGTFSAPLDITEPEIGTQLFVKPASAKDYTRAVCARTPNAEAPCASDRYFFPVRVYAPGGCREIKAEKGTLDPLLLDAEGKLVPDVRIVMFQKWSSGVMRVSKFDPETGRVTFHRATCGAFFFPKNNRFYVENSRAALDAPGEWYFDRKAGRIFYIPRPDEDLNTSEVVISTVPRNLVQISGDWKNGKNVEDLNFENLTFSFSDANIGPNYNASVQAAHTQRGAFNAVGWRGSHIENCVFSHLGENGITLLEGCQNDRIEQNHVYDLGAGGVCLSAVPLHGAAPDPEAVTAKILIQNNLIHHGGNIYHAACGLFFCGMVQHSVATHNDISNFYWAAVQIGWCWTADAPAYTFANELSYNHIHHYGSGVLCDLAGIYTLGNSDGTVLHHNHIHDGARYQRDLEGYGGWGIYYDQGTANIVSENNLVYNVMDGGFHIHNSCWPFNERVLNNIFAFSTNVGMMRNNTQNAKEFPFGAKFEHNIIYNRNPKMISGTGFAKDQKVLMSNNCYWATEGEPEFQGKSLSEWQAESGLEAGSRVVDPGFVDPENYDFRLKENSPALALGFVPFDVSSAGLTGDAAWRALAAEVVNREVEVHSSSPAASAFFADSFEEYESDDVPDRFVFSLGGTGGFLGLSDETASDGKKSIKFTDGPDLRFGYEPHAYIQQPFPDGPVTQTFRMNIPESYPILLEWRQYSGTSTYISGPAFIVTAAGELTACGRTLAQLPSNQWITYSVTCQSGPRAEGEKRTWTLTVTVPGQEPQVFADLSLNENFNLVEWMGFISIGKQVSSMFVDEMEVK